MTLIGAAQGSFETRLSDGSRLRARWGALTDTGLLRQRNEDSVVATEAVLAVADGMGGHEAGDRASAAIVEELSQLERDPQPQDIYAALRRASEDVEQISAASGGQSGSTVTGVAFDVVKDEPGWLVFNIGDSRTYGFYEGQLRQVTHDHSVVQGLVDSGQISEKDAERHPARNSITRAIGFGMDPRPDFWHLNLVPQVRLLVCSDGLTKEVSNERIEEILRDNDEAFAAAERLVEQALENGGRDNVSVIVVDSTVTAPSAATEEDPATEPTSGAEPQAQPETPQATEKVAPAESVERRGDGAE